MKSFLIFLSAFVVILVLFSLAAFTLIENNNEHHANSNTSTSMTALKAKLSIDQIDSLSAFENYRFTIENYYKDSAPRKAGTNKI